MIKETIIRPENTVILGWFLLSIGIVITLVIEAYRYRKIFHADNDWLTACLNKIIKTYKTPEDWNEWGKSRSNINVLRNKYYRWFAVDLFTGSVFFLIIYLTGRWLPFFFQLILLFSVFFILASTVNIWHYFIIRKALSRLSFQLHDTDIEGIK